MERSAINSRVPTSSASGDCAGTQPSATNGAKPIVQLRPFKLLKRASTRACSSAVSAGPSPQVPVGSGTRFFGRAFLANLLALVSLDIP